MSPPLVAVVAAVLLAAQDPSPQAQAAPPISATTWLNTGDSAPDFAGQVVLLEFWGTWCGPCVATMPYVQDLWTRYREQGLHVAAISYEAPDVLQPYLEQHGYTMPVGSDPEKRSIAAFDVKSWPTTVIIDKQGQIVFRGFPVSSEPALRKALGLESSPETLLTQYLDGSAEPQATLLQLVTCASRSFDLAAWANGLSPTHSTRPPRDAGELLTRLGSEWSTPRRAAHLEDLAAVQERFDLLGWATRQLGERFPISDEEFAEMLADGAYAEVIRAVATRHPSRKAAALVKADDGLRDHCSDRAVTYRENGRILVVLGHYLFGEYQAPQDIPLPPGTGLLSTESASGSKGIDGVALSTGERFLRDDFPACIEPYLMLSLTVDALSRRKLPDDLEADAAKRHAELLADARKRYGSAKRRE